MTEKVENKEVKDPAEIIRGRMPVAVVWVARFGNTKDDSVADQAAKFGTTVGKITDIRKNNNFKYITADTRFTREQIDQGIEMWMKRHPKFKDGAADEVINELNALDVATEKEAEAFLEARKSARGTSSTTKDGEVANAGGGNRRKSKKDEDEAPSADALLA